MNKINKISLFPFFFTLISILIFCNFVARTQNNFNNFLSLDTIISVPEVNFQNLGVLKYSFNGQSIFFTNFSGKSYDEIELYSVDFKSGKYFVYKGVFKISDDLEKKFKNYTVNFDDILVKNDLAFFSHYHYVYKYKIEKDSLILKDIYKSNGTNLLVCDNSIISTVNYNYYKSEFPRTGIYLYDSLFNFQDIFQSLKFDNLCYTHFTPNQWFSTNKELVSFSNTGRYLITFFNSSDFSVSSKIKYSKEGWVFPPKSNSKLFGKDCLEFFNKYERKVSRIHKSQFLNDSTFIVQYQMPAKSENDYSYYFDIWKLTKPGTWKIYHENQRISFDLIPKDSIMNKKNYPFNPLSFPYYSCKQDKIVELHLEPDINPIGMSYKDYLAEQNLQLVNFKKKLVLRLYLFSYNDENKSFSESNNNLTHDSLIKLDELYLLNGGITNLIFERKNIDIYCLVISDFKCFECHRDLSKKIENLRGDVNSMFLIILNNEAFFAPNARRAVFERYRFLVESSDRVLFTSTLVKKENALDTVQVPDLFMVKYRDGRFVQYYNEKEINELK
jgi:hypothetical protein